MRRSSGAAESGVARAGQPAEGVPFLGAKAAAGLTALGKRFSAIGWDAAGAGLREVRAVPTIFPCVDAVLGVGGWPIDRFGLVHGESAGGKSTFVLGLMLSFLQRGHAAAFIDAERTTPREWVTKLFPKAAIESPAFRVLYPTTYEDTRAAVRRWAEAIGDAREHGEIDSSTTGIVVLDSIRKLVPKKLFEALAAAHQADEADEKPKSRFAKKKPGGIDGAGGRAGQMKAQLNAAWMDELTVLLSQTGTGMVAIGREYAASDGGGPLGFGDDFVLGGGQSLFFESSVVARVGEQKGLYVSEGKEAVLVGQQHYVQIRKTKIEGKERKFPLAHFHMSNGGAYAFGFDMGRDLLEVGQDAGVVELRGSSYRFGDEVLGAGELAAARRLSEDPGLRGRLEAAVRATFPGVEAADRPMARPPAAAKKSAKKTVKRGTRK